MTVMEETFIGYDERRDSLSKWVKRNYIDEFKVKPRAMLDMACGNGFWASLFTEEGFEVTAFDISEEYLADGRSRWPDVHFVDGDVERFPVPWRFPFVFCRGLPYFYAENLEASLPIMRNAIDATASNGSLLLSFWTTQTREQSDRGHWMWDEGDFKRLIESAGGIVKKIVRAGNQLQILVHPAARPNVQFTKMTTGTLGSYPQSFSVNGLERLDEFLRSAKAVVPMRESPHARDIVAMRHDVDHSLEHALKFARWEAERGYRSTYFLLHTAPYWRAKEALYAGMRELTDMGHEIGLHVNAVIQARAEGKSSPQDGGANPAGNCARAAEIIHEAVTEIRSQGFEVVGTAAHGDHRCADWNLSNLDIWAAGYSPQDFGLEYEAYHRHQSANYISDNGGKWIGENNEILYTPHFHKSLATHLLVHPIHWPVNEL